ncbi:hypothetical protein SLEP1_g18865 [Rubroshorea leprosula]|uniref:C2 domain-containing protein n=1 Tax=Rubroshorea leprosula TaxID=152421 RepID=A0AAV5JAS2_9ROSI|nr:hypothetical protein SLEP1_g18865 [Rubroshorea leprosula]
MAPTAHSSRVLEIDLINAQDLAPMSKSMKTYAVAWVEPDPERKLATGVDQMGHINPMWNDRLMFRVDDKFLHCEDAEIVIEIYTAAWVKDALIGYVRVLLNDLFRLRSSRDTKVNNSTMRIVSLQVRRPNGRPQGMLNMGVALLESTMRSMPIYTELSESSSIDYTSIDESKGSNKTKHNDNKNKKNQNRKKQNGTPKLCRSQSDRTDLTTDEYARNIGSIINGGSIVNAGSSVVNAESMCNGSMVKCGGSMVNGESLCNSDVGPSASVVAAAIAKGLLRSPIQDDKPSEAKTLLKEWTKKEKQEDLSMKLERWRPDIPPLPNHQYRSVNLSKRRNSHKKKDNRGLFSCFGTVFGCEISITCGGASKRKKRHGSGKKRNGNGNNKVCHLSSVEDNYSQSYV